MSGFQDVRLSRGFAAALLILALGACAQTAGPGPAGRPSAQDETRQQATRPQRSEHASRPRTGPDDRAAPSRRMPPGQDETRTYRVVGVGDIMMGSNHPDERLDSRLTPGVDPAAIVGPELASLLRGADVAFGNLEGTIHDLEEPSKECRNPDVCYVFRSPPHYADILARLGFDMLSLANNHAGDFLEPGRLATAENLDRAGIAYGGSLTPGLEESVVTLADGTRVGFVAFAPNRGTLSINNIPAAVRRVRALEARSDFTVVSFHGGAEGGEAATVVPREMEIFLGEQRGDVYAFAHAVIDAGADVVFGHGPHVPRAVEVYRGRFIAYSLGNFWTYGRFNLQGYRGLAPVADLQVRRDGTLVSARIHSVRQVDWGVPTMDPEKGALRAVETFTRRDFPESQLVFLADGRIRGPGIEVAQDRVSELAR